MVVGMGSINKKAKDTLGNRIKFNYENRQRFYLTRRTPVIVRVDGKAFHSYTRGCERPFDKKLISSMVAAAQKVAESMQGFKAAYVQSDEVSFLLTDYDGLNTDAWFDYNKSKVETISASTMSGWFNRLMDNGKVAVFDARSFNIPREEVANYFLWRAKDWERNSLTMYCGAFFSHKQLHQKNRSNKHEMLHSIGKNWTTDLDAQLRNGTLILRVGTAENRTTFKHENPDPIYANFNTLLDPLINCNEQLPNEDPRPAAV